MTPLKNTSMVHFEDEIINECDESRDTQLVPKKKTSGSQRGILKRPHNSENHENLVNGIVPRKKKTSLVCFQDEVLSFNINNFTDYHRIALPAKGEEPIEITKGDLEAETSNKGLHDSDIERFQMYSCCDKDHGSYFEIIYFVFQGD